MDDVEDNSFLNEQKPPVERDLKPIIAAVLLFLAGMFGLVQWGMMLSLDAESLYEVAMPQMEGFNITSADFASFLNTCAIIGIIISIFPILGGILAIQRKIWAGAIVCSIIGIFSIGFVGLTSILCIIAVILLFLSKNQFVVEEKLQIDDL